MVTSEKLVIIVTVSAGDNADGIKIRLGSAASFRPMQQNTVFLLQRNNVASAVYLSLPTYAAKYLCCSKAMFPCLYKH